MDERAPNEYQRLRSTHQITVNEVQNQHQPIGVFSSAFILTFFSFSLLKSGKIGQIFIEILEQLEHIWFGHRSSMDFRRIQIWAKNSQNISPRNKSMRPENIGTISFCSDISACLSLLFAVSLLKSNSIQRKLINATTKHLAHEQHRI